MIIKSGEEIEVTFTAIAVEDVDTFFLMDQLFDSLPQFRVFNPSYKKIKQEKPKASDLWD